MKILIAAALALTPTVANAGTPVVLDIDRIQLITNAAATICRQAVDEPGDAADLALVKSRYLHLDEAEELYLLSLCILYVQGRQDQAPKGRFL